MVLFGFQHVLAMYAGAIAVPLLVAGGIGLTRGETSTLIQCNLLMCGVATLIQSYGIGRFAGIRMPVMMGVTFTAVPPLLLFGKSIGLPAVFGAVMVSGLIVLLIAPWFARMVRFFSPLVIGSVILTIGLSLIPLAVRWSLGVDAPTGQPVTRNLLVAAVVALTIVGIYLMGRFRKGSALASYSVLIGFAVGIALALALGMFSFSGIPEVPFFSFPPLMPFGWPVFNFAVIVNILIVNLISMVESLGVFYAVSAATGLPVGKQEITRGYRAEGLAIMLGGLFSSFPYTTFSQNAGLIALTGVKSRFVLVASGIMLVLMGFFLQVSWFLAAIPPPVIGGAALVMFMTIVAAGFQILRKTNVKRGGNFLVPLLAAGMGLVTALFPEIFSVLPPHLAMLFSNSIATGSVVAVVVWLLLRVPYLLGKSDMHSMRYAALLQTFIRCTDQKEQTSAALQRVVLPLLPNRRVLADMGCGTGDVSANLVPLFEKILLYDLNPSNIHTLRKRFNQPEPAAVKSFLSRFRVSKKPNHHPKGVSIGKADLNTFVPDFHADLILFSFSLGYTGLALQEQDRLPFRLKLVEQYMGCLNPGGRLVIVDTADLGPYRNLFDYMAVPVHAEMSELIEALAARYPTQQEYYDVSVRTDTVAEMVLCLRLITYDDGTKFLNLIPWYHAFANALPREDGKIVFSYVTKIVLMC